MKVYVCAGVSPYARISAHIPHTNKTNQANKETNTNKQINKQTNKQTNKTQQINKQTNK